MHVVRGGGGHALNGGIVSVFFLGGQSCSRLGEKREGRRRKRQTQMDRDRSRGWDRDRDRDMLMCLCHVSLSLSLMDRDRSRGWDRDRDGDTCDTQREILDRERERENVRERGTDA
jgi:hypothetical protein